MGQNTVVLGKGIGIPIGDMFVTRTRRNQVLVVIRETTTAKAMRTPQRHLSHTTCRHVVAQLPSPAPVVETARPFRGRTTPTILGTTT
jgi:hypothetical protein